MQARPPSQLTTYFSNPKINGQFSRSCDFNGQPSKTTPKNPRGNSLLLLMESLFLQKGGKKVPFQTRILKSVDLVGKIAK